MDFAPYINNKLRIISYNTIPVKLAAITILLLQLVTAKIDKNLGLSEWAKKQGYYIPKIYEWTVNGLWITAEIMSSLLYSVLSVSINLGITSLLAFMGLPNPLLTAAFLAATDVLLNKITKLICDKIQNKIDEQTKETESTIKEKPTLKTTNIESIKQVENTQPSIEQLIKQQTLLQNKIDEIENKIKLLGQRIEALQSQKDKTQTISTEPDTSPASKPIGQTSLTNKFRKPTNQNQKNRTKEKNNSKQYNKT